MFNNFLFIISWDIISLPYSVYCALFSLESSKNVLFNNEHYNLILFHTLCRCCQHLDILRFIMSLHMYSTIMVFDNVKHKSVYEESCTIYYMGRVFMIHHYKNIYWCSFFLSWRHIKNKVFSVFCFIDIAIDKFYLPMNIIILHVVLMYLFLEFLYKHLFEIYINKIISQTIILST